MATAKRASKRKYFTVAQANAMLPLLRSILRDVTELAQELRDRHDRMQRLQKNEQEGLGSAAHREEVDHITIEFERGRERMHELLDELDNLGIELKDPFAGLVDFRSKMDGREVYLCWRLDEPEVAHWHELNAGFTGRQKLMEKAASQG
jgi:hypothetical protein